MPAIIKSFVFVGDDTVELSRESKSLKNKIVSHDENWLVETKAKLLKQFDDKKEQI